MIWLNIIQHKPYPISTHLHLYKDVCNEMNSYLSKKKRKNPSWSSLQICQFIQIGWSLRRTPFQDAMIIDEKWTKNG